MDKACLSTLIALLVILLFKFYINICYVWMFIRLKIRVLKS